MPATPRLAASNRIRLAVCGRGNPISKVIGSGAGAGSVPTTSKLESTVSLDGDNLRTRTSSVHKAKENQGADLSA